MQFRLHPGELHVPLKLEKAIAGKVGKIEKRLKRYHPDAADLEVRLTHEEKLDAYECRLVLRAFKDTLYAAKTAPDLRVAVDRSFEAIMRELEHYRVKLNKSLQDHT